MKNNRFYSSILLTFFAIGFLAKCNSSNEVLFEENGNNWFTEGDASWGFDDNELVGIAKGGAGFIMTKNLYKDFMLELEFKPDSTINSGIFIRCKNKELSMVDCYENNIWDLHPNQENRTGSVVNRAKPQVQVETLDKWNIYKIIIEKNHLRTWVNGKLTTDIINNDLIEGMIALQAAETGIIRFRNIKIQNLGPSIN